MSESPNVQSTTNSTTHPGKAPLTFEFTKRKRWADLLATELVDAIIFVVSPTTKVLYCGNSITGLLGWRESDIVDRDLVDFISVEDQARFRRDFDESYLTNSEILSYAHVRSNPSLNSLTSTPQKISFEFKGYPHFVPDRERDSNCFFLMAKPYLSRNTSMLNTMLDLKIENNRLQRKVMELRSQVPGHLVSDGARQTSSVYATSTMSSSFVPTGSSRDPSSPFYTSSSLVTMSHDENGLGNAQKDFNSGSVFGAGVTNVTNDDGEDASKKKKPKKSHGAQQYVCITCGRTDSPEWRKGPSGPKTLCNACGLRWAKQMRKTDESPEGNTNMVPTDNDDHGHGTSVGTTA